MRIRIETESECKFTYKKKIKIAQCTTKAIHNAGFNAKLIVIGNKHIIERTVKHFLIPYYA